MKEIFVDITGLNCAYSEGMTNLVKIDKNEYATDKSERSVFIPDISNSYFHLNSRTKGAFLEPFFYNLRKGDIFEIEFESKSNSENAETTINFVHIDEAGKEIQLMAPAKTNNISAGSFEKHIIKVIMNRNTNIFIPNFRNDTMTSELILKNIKIKIVTSNYSLDNYTQVIDFSDSNELFKMINHVSQSNVRTDYKNMKELLYTNKVNISNGKLEFKDAGLTAFKGLIGCFSLPKNCKFTLVLTGKFKTDRSTLTTNRYLNDKFTTKKEMSFVNTQKSIYQCLNFHFQTDIADRIFVDFGAIASGGANSLYENMKLILVRFDGNNNSRVNDQCDFMK